MKIDAGNGHYLCVNEEVDTGVFFTGFSVTNDNTGENILLGISKVEGEPIAFIGWPTAEGISGLRVYEKIEGEDRFKLVGVDGGSSFGVIAPFIEVVGSLGAVIKNESGDGVYITDSDVSVQNQS